MTRHSIKREGKLTLVCRESTKVPRDSSDSKFVCALCDNVRVGPVMDTKTMNLT